jgi:hypothetical protein
MVRVRAIVRRRKYFSIAPDEIAALGEVHPYLTFRLCKVCTKCALTQDTAFTAVAPLNSTGRVLFFFPLSNARESSAIVVYDDDAIDVGRSASEGERSQI